MPARLLALALALTVLAPPLPARASPSASSRRATASWLRPVPGAVLRPFALGISAFARGQHRGVDLRAAVGTRVHSACRGRVLFAGSLPARGRAVTVRCGRWRVTYLHLSAVTVRRGRGVGPGTAIGRTGRPGGERPHLHVGVRRDGSAFGYVDPLAFFGSAGAPAPHVVAPPPRPPPHTPRIARRPSPAPAPASLPLAPWPAWLGTGLLLAGAWPAARSRRRRAPPGRGARVTPAWVHRDRSSSS